MHKMILLALGKLLYINKDLIKHSTYTNGPYYPLHILLSTPTNKKMHNCSLTRTLDITGKSDLWANNKWSNNYC